MAALCVAALSVSPLKSLRCQKNPHRFIFNSSFIKHVFCLLLTWVCSSYTAAIVLHSLSPPSYLSPFSPHLDFLCWTPPLLFPGAEVFKGKTALTLTSSVLSGSQLIFLSPLHSPINDLSLFPLPFCNLLKICKLPNGRLPGSLCVFVCVYVCVLDTGTSRLKDFLILFFTGKDHAGLLQLQKINIFYYRLTADYFRNAKISCFN